MAVNVPPEREIRVPAEELRRFAGKLFEAAGTNREDADQLSSILVETDLRGIFSHGTTMMNDYLRQMLKGDVNPRPTASNVSDRRPALIDAGRKMLRSIRAKM